jgi:hypothetical protein
MDCRFGAEPELVEHSRQLQSGAVVVYAEADGVREGFASVCEATHGSVRLPKSVVSAVVVGIEVENATKAFDGAFELTLLQVMAAEVVVGFDVRGAVAKGLVVLRDGLEGSAEEAQDVRSHEAGLEEAWVGSDGRREGRFGRGQLIARFESVTEIERRHLARTERWRARRGAPRR